MALTLEDEDSDLEETTPKQAKRGGRGSRGGRGKRGGKKTSSRAGQGRKRKKQARYV